jgi:aminocarboxymuconate-semialdehyde decarboxylase
MPGMMTVDAHAHVLDIETVRILQREAPGLAPKLTPIDDEFAVFEGPDMTYKPFPRGAWDLERRLQDMERYGLDRQVVAVCPQTLIYGAEPVAALAVAQIQNDQIAAMCAAHPLKFAGLATAPMQAPELAAVELTRAMREKRLGGAMIGSNIKGMNLDDPSLEPFWAAADALSALIMVHPVHVAGADRQKDYYLKNIVGNPIDTTIAAACLVFGGVIARYPRITFLMAHGGGFTPYQAGRFVHGWNVRGEPRSRHGGHPAESLSKLVYDTILHAPEPLRFLIDTAGPERLVLGTDYPFDMGQYDIVTVLRGLGLAPEDEAEIASGTIGRLLPSGFAATAE